MADPQYVWPLRGKIAITNPYGAKQVRSAGFKGPLPEANVGLDLGAPEGTPLVAIADGTVIESGWNTSGWGNTLLVRTADGGTYRLSHMKQAPSVGVGAKVAQGAPVGQVGQSGNATGPHVDVEVRDRTNRNIDPTPLLGWNGTSPYRNRSNDRGRESIAPGTTDATPGRTHRKG